MMNKLRTPQATLADLPSPQRPVRVKLRRADAYVAQAYPPDGESERWWARLNTALGTVSSDFVNASLFQLQTAARSPFGNISETAMNAALAMIAAIAPKDEIEGALAVQMSCTHAVAMAVLAKMDIAFGTERRVTAFGSTASRLLRTYAMQTEVLRRLRHGGQQCIRIEHVHISDGGQAVIGNVKADKSGGPGVEEKPAATNGHKNGHAGDEKSDFYARARAIMGNAAGGLATKLLQAKGGNVALARAALETASTKGTAAREYIGGVIRGAAVPAAEGWDPRL